MPKSIAEQVREAYEADGRSMRVLLKDAGLPFGVPTLSKKLSGKIPMSTHESERLAVAMDVQLVYPAKRAARAA